MNDAVFIMAGLDSMVSGQLTGPELCCVKSECVMKWMCKNIVIIYVNIYMYYSASVKLQY